MIFFTSDLHLGHKNIITFCNRPFENVEAMNEAIICNWNATVKKGDDVYILGDVEFRNARHIRPVLTSMHGNKFLIKGNHDKRVSKELDLFVWVKDLYTLKVPDVDAPGGKRAIVLCHYPMRSWHMSNHGSWHLHGHCHGSLPRHGLSLDVGVDSWGFAPVSYEQIKEKMDEDKT